MFNLFNKKSKFPKETEKGQVYVKDNQLFYINHGYEESVNLAHLKYAYVEILGVDPYLFLHDNKQHYIPVLQKGFSTAYPQLSERFGFDDALFFKTIAKKKEQKHCIYRLKVPANYKILPTRNTDYKTGFEVQTTPPTFVSWDTTYDEILQLNIGHLYNSEYDIQYFKIDYPVRVGALLMNKFEFCYDESERLNIAVQVYFSTLYADSNSDESYNELRKLWMEEVPTEVDEAGYERTDQKYLNFDLNAISLSIYYSYDLESQYDSGATELSITNYRDYTEQILQNKLLLNPASTKIISFDTPLSFQPNFKLNPRVISRPDLLEGNDQALWLADNDTLGFTGEEFAITFNRNELSQLVVQNVLPAKGGGYVELFVRLKSDDLIRIYYGDQNALDAYVQPLEELLNIAVEMPEPYYNC